MPNKVTFILSKNGKEVISGTSAKLGLFLGRDASSVLKASTRGTKIKGFDVLRKEYFAEYKKKYRYPPKDYSEDTAPLRPKTIQERYTTLGGVKMIRHLVRCRASELKTHPSGYKLLHTTFLK